MPLLNLSHINKYYHVGDTVTKAQDDVSVEFRKQEFVAILGPSGSGKTTMLNIIGGLDRYDSGDLLIKGKSTKNFKDSEWDAYRNNSVGFIFQSYNLISHLSILENVEMGMTLSGVPSAIKKQKATDALIRVGLKDQIRKQPNQLSGGQMQRVAIARAIANDPEILLADEPTGALDSETSDEIMQLIRDLSKDRLVIMVTHNPDLAHKYADRIIEFADGQIQNDSKPFEEEQAQTDFSLNNTKMSYWTALMLSYTNIRTKKGRTFLTVFASSIGIISIAVVLALSNGFQKQVDESQSDALSTMPVTVSPTSTDPSAMSSSDNTDKKLSKNNQVKAEKSAEDKAQHTNKITTNYLDYLNKMPKKDAKNIAVSYGTGMNLLRKVNGKYKPVTFSTSNPDNSSTSASAMMSASTGLNGSVYPVDRNGKQSFLRTYYKVIAGSYPTKSTDIVLVVDKDNTVNINALKNLGFTVKEGQKFNYKDLVGTKIKVVANDNYYTKLPTGNYVSGTDYAKMAAKASTKTLTVKGIIRVKASGNSDGILANGVAYSANLTKDVLKANKNSKIVTAQKKSNNNVMTGQKMDNATRSAMLTTLGGDSTPTNIQIYPTKFKQKDKVLSYLDKYNKGKSKTDKVVYTDLASTISKMTGGIMDAITYVLVAFAGISLVTSMIMIAIITYTSVLERTKEIGVLKALGARKKDITRVFDAETFILGFGAGVFGIFVAWALTFPINAILENVTGLAGVAVLNPTQAVILVIVSTILTMLGGHIPARMAAKKDAAIALRAD